MGGYFYFSSSRDTRSLLDIPPRFGETIAGLLRRRCEERSDEAIRLSPGVGMDCFASLAITDGGDCAAYCCDCHCPDRPARSTLTATVSVSAPPPQRVPRTGAAPRASSPIATTARGS